eukprot:NODE_3664_length_2002_cov_5.939200.p1 GENE.NODE_3664_length_2002_cov_5.939200~~NODE_3664_length_2002_cov_5.939200.p1  ORF type:complete len:535 (+),score=139.56 NODE_3664_length_2002_cov_5.939200:182-1606(+)
MNEDFMRILISHIPKESLVVLGEVWSKDRDMLLHVLCKGSATRAFPSTASRADVMLLLLTVCPPGTFDLEAQDGRGQTPLHLAAQSGDVALIQVLLEHGADPNTQEETTGWTPLHFAVAKNHYALILQLLHHDATNVNQVDKFDWPPLLEACSRLDARSTSLLVNGSANIGFRNQHHFDVLKAVDTSKKDLAAKRWMSCLVVCNGFNFEESMVQLNSEDRETLVRERQYFGSRQTPAGNPPFFVPDHLAPRCHSCKVAFSMQLRRSHCRSCGLVLCAQCLKPKATHIVALDERMKSRQVLAQAFISSSDDDACGEGRLIKGDAALKDKDKTGAKGSHPSAKQMSTKAKAQSASKNLRKGMSASPRADDFEDPPMAEEQPPAAPPSSVVCPGSMPGAPGPPLDRVMASPPRREGRVGQGSLSRDWSSTGESSSGVSITRTVRLCTACTVFFEVGVGETYAMLQRKGTQSVVPSAS